jgi:ABC-type amino acid transport substrate-binding protein
MKSLDLKSNTTSFSVLICSLHKALIKPLRLQVYVIFKAPSLLKFIASLFILLCASPQTGLALSFDDIIKNGIISIAVYRDFPPFSYRDQDILKGVDVEIATTIAQKLGVTLNLIEQTADETVDDDLRNAIWKGHFLDHKVADIMLHIPYDKVLGKRNNQVVLFSPYFQEDIVVARDREKLGPNANLAIFRYEKIGVELDTLADMYLSGAFGGSIRKNLMHYITAYEATDKLKSKDIAGVMGVRSVIEGGLGKDRTAYDIGKIPTPGLSKDAWLLGLAVKSSYRQLGNEVADIIASMVQDGSMKALFEKYGLTYVAPDASFYN